MKLKALLAFTLVSASTLASAQWYGGISAGMSDLSLSDSDVRVTGATAFSVQKDKGGTGFKVQAGYQVSKNLAIEGGYVNLGKAKTTNTVTAPASGSLIGEISSEGWNLMAVGVLPTSEKFSLLGKLGVILSTNKLDYSRTGGVTISGASSFSKSELNPALGLGVQYAFTEKMSVRAEMDSFVDLRVADTGGKVTVNLFSLGLYMKF